jgi:hypothetical protein
MRDGLQVERRGPLAGNVPFVTSAMKVAGLGVMSTVFWNSCRPCRVPTVIPL